MQSRSHLSLTVHTVYVLLTGLQLVFIPNMFLNMFGFDSTSEIWIKVLGVVVLSLVFIYDAINKSGNADVLKGTVLARLFVGLSFILLALTQDKINIILFAGIDIATGLWTWTELKKKK